MRTTPPRRGQGALRRAVPGRYRRNAIRRFVRCQTVGEAGEQDHPDDGGSKDEGRGGAFVPTDGGNAAIAQDGGYARRKDGEGEGQNVGKEEDHVDYARQGYCSTE